MSLRIEEFDYSLPKELIAQHPEEERASSRLLVMGRDGTSIQHRYFRDIGEYLRAGDVLVLNNTRVLPARISASKPTGGRVDILMVEEISDTKWSCLVNGLKRSIHEQQLTIGSISVTVRRREETWEIEFPNRQNVMESMEAYGRMPLPPYIRRGENGIGSSDFDRYQTVYATRLGSIAAPTAGLHFSSGLLQDLQERGVSIVYVTLHIGIGTFFLIKKEDVADHDMHREWYSIDPQVAQEIRKARSIGGRVVAVGTSAVRTLETFFSREDQAPSGYTNLFIYPGYEFRVVDMFVTNFHLPRSTPLLLTSAFAGKDNLLTAYQVAIEKGYRFYSYGDAMLIQ
jgi:S-adenosylmethionine:tRNA ribosyltransferase-isomerase